MSNKVNKNKITYVLYQEFNIEGVQHTINVLGASSEEQVMIDLMDKNIKTDRYGLLAKGGISIYGTHHYSIELNGSSIKYDIVCTPPYIN